MGDVAHRLPDSPVWPRNRWNRDLWRVAELHTRAPRHSNQMHQCIGGTPESQHSGYRVVKRFRCQYLCGANVLPDHLHDALPGLHRHLCVARVRRWYGCCTGQCESQSLCRTGHGAGRTHGHAMTRRTGNAGEDLFPIALAAAALDEGSGAWPRRFPRTITIRASPGRAKVTTSLWGPREKD